MAGRIAALWNMMLLGAAAIFLFVMLLLVIGALRPPVEGAPRRPGLWLGGGGVAFTGVVVVALLVAGLRVGEASLPHAAPDVVRIDAEASQWRWVFHYPDSSVALATVTEMFIPANRPVDVYLSSPDVIHSFWAPRLAGKMDAIPGQTNRLRIEAAAPGRYGGVCAEYCGPHHAEHTFQIIALDPAAWTKFLRGETIPERRDAR